MNASEDKEKLNCYFDLLKDVLKKKDLLNCPGQIYVDESGLPLDHRPSRLLVRKGQCKVRYCNSGNKSQMTVVGVANDGNAIPPLSFSMPNV